MPSMPLSLLIAFFSICLILSLVKPNMLPISSNVLFLPSDRPNLSWITSFSLVDKLSNKPLISSLVIPFETASGGASLDLSSIKLPISVVESSPISVASETGREEAERTVLILAFGKPDALDISSIVGSLLYS